MSFGGQEPSVPAKELKRSPDSLAVAGRRCGNKRRRERRREEGKKKGRGKLRTHEVFYEHLALSPAHPQYA